MMQHWLVQNLTRGFCYSFFLPYKKAPIHASWNALIAIMALFIFTQWLSDALINGQDNENIQLDSGWHDFHCALLVLTLLGSYCVNWIVNKTTSHLLELSVTFYNSYYFIFIPFLVLETIWPAWYYEKVYDGINNLIYIWVFLISLRIIAEACPPTELIKQIMAALIMSLSICTLHSYSYFEHFYYSYNDTEEEPEFPEYEALTSEELSNNQAPLIDLQLQEFKPSSPGTTDIYGISFGSYAYQDVFMRESQYVAKRMHNVLEIDTGVITLINNPETALDIPLASTTNLQTSLKSISQNMQQDEDILMLYLTSHGGKKSGLSVRLDYKYSMMNLDGERLRQILDESNIKNRIIIISACYSGTFIPFLEDDNTMVITASANNKQSYGCTDEADLTYFAQAYFKEALSETTDLEDAFHRATQKIEDRENRENLEKKSNPQIFIGQNIKAILAKYKEGKLSTVRTNNPGTDHGE
ncbi:MAG: C13 family peptidase [Alphaproteobacteria bacterium]